MEEKQSERLKYVANLRRLAEEAYAEHKIVQREKRAWLVRRERTGFYWFEAFALQGGRLIVHGDIRSVIFQCGSEQDAESRVHFIADSHLGYAKEKAELASGMSFDEVDEAVARDDLCILLSDRETLDEHERKLVVEALEEMGHSGVVALDQLEGEVFHGIGVVPSPRLIYAHEAVKCLSRLIKVDQGQEVK
jgi:hypothetical protein